MMLMFQELERRQYNMIKNKENDRISRNLEFTKWRVKSMKTELRKLDRSSMAMKNDINFVRELDVFDAYELDVSSLMNTMNQLRDEIKTMLNKANVEIL